MASHVLNVLREDTYLYPLYIMSKNLWCPHSSSSLWHHTKNNRVYHHPDQEERARRTKVYAIRTSFVRTSQRIRKNIHNSIPDPKRKSGISHFSRTNLHHPSIQQHQTFLKRTACSIAFLLSREFAHGYFRFDKEFKKIQNPRSAAQKSKTIKLNAKTHRGPGILKTQRSQ